MTTLIERTRFESQYAAIPPWEIGRAQSEFINHADQIKGVILDSGCGTGENALHFASLGNQVSAIDFLSVPIIRARQKATERKIDVTFLVMDALALKGLSEVFDCIIDSGLFHAFNDEDRVRYVSGLSTALKPGGRFFLLCFSDDEPGSYGPRRVSRVEIEEAFQQKWQIEKLIPSRYELRPDFAEADASVGGAKAWFAVIKRV